MARKVDWVNPLDGMDWLCERLMAQLRREYSGHKAEISSKQLVKFTQRFSNTYQIKHADMLAAMIRRGWLEPSAADTYHINYSAVRR